MPSLERAISSVGFLHTFGAMPVDEIAKRWLILPRTPPTISGAPFDCVPLDPAGPTLPNANAWNFRYLARLTVQSVNSGGRAGCSLPRIPFSGFTPTALGSGPLVSAPTMPVARFFQKTALCAQK